jgi:hypothetical protein
MADGDAQGLAAFGSSSCLGPSRDLTVSQCFIIRFIAMREFEHHSSALGMDADSPMWLLACASEAVTAGVNTHSSIFLEAIHMKL